MAFGKRKKQDEVGLDVLTEMKEPFSFANFFEDHVVGRIKKIKKFLEEKGVLFFLLSPFQQRNRLIAQLLIIVLGVGIGVVPRSAHLIEQAKIRNAKSELATLLEKEVQVSCGRISIRPLMSSQYEEQHVMAFLLGSSGGGAVPSTADRYEVNLTAARGVSYPEDVSYRYEVLPISSDQRLLLVYTDNRKQEDATGIYNLTVQVKADELAPEDIEPLEVVLSDTQETTDLFGAEGMDLSVLTDVVLNDPNTPIQKAEDDLQTALMDYTMETERIQGLPLALEIQPTTEELEAFVKEHSVYPELTDKSTTGDIKDLTEIKATDEEGNPKMALKYQAGIVYNGKTYTSDYLDTATSEGAVTGAGAATEVTLTEEETTVLEEVESLQGAVDDVLRKMERLNQAKQTKFGTLKDLKLMLNQSVDFDDFSKPKTVGDTVS